MIDDDDDDDDEMTDDEECLVAEDGDHCAHWYDDKLCCHCGNVREKK